ncbi:AraC-type DNA-binding protein [Ruegeria marina]|uniref:AraC-type DNA-binding protein n=2 Tax=Ruegeria marina TaxID=639004 RepID=A0A1G7F7K0_9RHOB|nr:AraC-type DNA-binding protein [Ruegeria marina]
MVEGPPIFVPYALQAAYAEHLARQLGERHVGPNIVSQYGYKGLGLYARYVLGAPRLDIAFARGIRALPYLQSGASVNLHDAGDCIILQFGSGIHSIVGAGHIDEGTSILLIDLVRHFLGKEWNPEWVELSGKRFTGDEMLEDLLGAPVRYGKPLLGIAILKDQLQTHNPRPEKAPRTVLFKDLRKMINHGPPRTMVGLVREALLQSVMEGNPCEDAVTAWLGLGKRTLQRQLAVEGNTFRKVFADFRIERAKAMLAETNQSARSIAASLGYHEVNSFRRAFSRSVGCTPAEYSALCRAQPPDVSVVRVFRTSQAVS